MGDAAALERLSRKLAGVGVADYPWSFLIRPSTIAVHNNFEVGDLSAFDLHPEGGSSLQAIHADLAELTRIKRLSGKSCKN